MRVGYVRCSTIEQNEARQLKMMEEQKAEKLFIDKASGKNTDRKAFKEMMAFVRAGVCGRRHLKFRLSARRAE